MAKNDLLLLDWIIQEMIEQNQPSDKKGEVFEYFATEQILKEFDLSEDDILNWLIDWWWDWWIDGFFIFVNWHIIQDLEDFKWPKTNSELQLYLITCKHHDTFKQVTLDAFIASITEILDFTIEDAKLKWSYSELLIQQRNILKIAYSKTSMNLSKFIINVFYTSRWDTDIIWKEVIARWKQITWIIKELFSNCNCNTFFIWSKELIELYRNKPKYTLELNFNESLSKWERYVLLVSLKDYYNFVSDSWNLRKYLFDSNVRDYMWLNRVNEDIKLTLDNENSTDFWLLNNWVTILATKASLTWRTIQIQNIQIVNWLQTTQSIFNYFSWWWLDINNRSVLIKVIVTNDSEVSDTIIRATNNQTNIELTSLHATEKIQRDIEDIMLKNDFWYERRTNFYKNQWFKTNNIITPLYIWAWYTSLILKNVNVAIMFSYKRIEDEKYNLVFSENIPIEVRPKITNILKKIDFIANNLKPINKSTNKFLKRWRHIISFFLISLHYKNFAFNLNDLMKYDISNINNNSVEEIWNKLETYKSNWENWNFIKLCQLFENDFWIKWISLVRKNSKLFKKKMKIELSEDFIELIKNNLPKQPWPIWTSKLLFEKLWCKYEEIELAISKLIERWFFYYQEDGVLYNKDWKIVWYDKIRVDSKTMKLKNNN